MRKEIYKNYAHRLHKCVWGKTFAPDFFFYEFIHINLSNLDRRAEKQFFHYPININETWQKCKNNFAFSTRPHSNLTVWSKKMEHEKRKRKADDGNDYGKRKKVIEIFSDRREKKRHLTCKSLIIFCKRRANLPPICIIDCIKWLMKLIRAEIALWN